MSIREDAFLFKALQKEGFTPEIIFKFMNALVTLTHRGFSIKAHHE